MEAAVQLAGVGSRAVVLVEGASDRIALERIAARRGRDLAGEGVSIVAMGGARSITRFLLEFGPRGRDVRIAGLCDEREERDVRRGLARAGFAKVGDRADLERSGFFVCVADLEDELIRAVGVQGVLDVIEAEGQLRSFGTLQRQPAQRGRPVTLQLRRFMGGRSGHKLRYAELLADAVDLDRVPRPLDGVLAHV